MMYKIELKHDRSSDKTSLKIDGNDAELSCLGAGTGIREIDWAKFFDELIKERCALGSGSECEIEFWGTWSDFEALEKAQKEFCDKNPGIGIKLTSHCGGYLQELNKRKDEVLRVWEEYKPFRERNSDNIHGLENTAQNIKEDKFILMVAGEAKSGKSTFINAFLGVDLLPVDIKQCTSAIIEITHDKEITLTATKAGGPSETREGEKLIREFLKEHAALSDKFREIPVTAINNEILIRSKGDVKQKEIEDLIKAVEADNIYHLPPEEYKKDIYNYIHQYKDKWQDIVTQISITYRLPDEMQYITVIDSPGVNAGGKVGTITEDFIKKADAIIFVKTMAQANALESSSFSAFFNSNTVDLSKAARFLVFTGKSLLSDSDFKEKSRQALDMYKTCISDDHIAFVDSKAQLLYHTCENLTESDIDKLTEDDNTLAGVWYKSTKEKTEFSDKLMQFRNSMKEKAGFDKISEMLNKFAGTAHYNRLLDFLGNINKGYGVIKATLEEHKKILEDSAEDPAKLKIEVEKKRAEIDEIEKKLHIGIYEIQDRYMKEDSGRIKNKAEEEFIKFKINLKSATNWDLLKKKAQQGWDEYLRFQDVILEEILVDCDKELVALTDKTSLSYETVRPQLTGADFTKLKEETEPDANKTEDYEEGCWIFAETKKRSVYSLEEHLNFVKDKIRSNLEHTKTDMVNSLLNFVDSVCKVYSKALSENLNKRKWEYDDLEHRLDNAKKIQEEKEQISSTLIKIEENIKAVERIKGGLKDAVK